jgi:hypothetical protein
MLRPDLERAIIEALAYSDIFEYPLQLDELHRYLPMRADADEVSVALKSLTDRVGNQDGYYYLHGRAEIVHIRKHREARSQELLPHAIRYGKILGTLPFVRMVGLTGSLAVMNVSKNADFDYMLVVQQGRVWTARLFAMVVNRVARLFGYTLCPNLIVAETALEWSLHDLYSARELYQMVPVTGMDVYQKVMKANEWAKDFLPNAVLSLRGATKGSDEAISSTVTGIASSGHALLAMTEWVLRSKLGDKLEAWEMNRKIAKFSKQPGFGEETIFNAEVCQGNFHHHRKWTHEVFQERLHVIASEAKQNAAISNIVTEIASSPIGSSQ